MSARTDSSSGVIAVLGPTNTGKTHLAVERMLAHESGMVGLPLRLLAREVYDRAVELKGRARVALITGEERILPPRPRYFVCTVESMPRDREVEFLAVDEIQLCADGERGHVFTDRLLHARGRRETMFLGADTMRWAIRALLPDVEFVSRPRFSVLRYSGERRLSRLPRRSAVVAFSAEDVYGLAELMRRQRGGCAVILGALSPRTRNAQVALYQAGEVDYLVATDAIGMGLNMNVDHVAFAALGKFDGFLRRPLDAAEIAQIGGRAGRHMNDGTFGTTTGAGPIEPELVESVERHQFAAIRHLQWRARELDFNSTRDLARSLDAPPPREMLVKARPSHDLVALEALARDPEIAALARGRAAVRRLWEVCRIPDFRKSMTEAHHRLLAQIYRHLRSRAGVLPSEWVAEQVERLDRSDGEIDTLAARIAHVRTWTYVSHRNDWMVDAEGWQARAREIEDKLSDALHQALTRRFVDRRTSVLMRRMSERGRLLGAVTGDGQVLVEGQYVGRLKGLAFTPDAADPGAEARAVRTAANRVLAREVGILAVRLAEAAATEIVWRDDNLLWWREAPVARPTPGTNPLRPIVALLPADHVEGPLRERVRRRLDDWLGSEIERRMGPLVRLATADLAGSARGIAYQVVEALGAIPREAVEELIRSLDAPGRAALKALGVRLGFLDVYLTASAKPERAWTAARLWSVARGAALSIEPPVSSRVSAPADRGWPEGLLRACGYREISQRIYRIDMLDRVAAQAMGAAKRGPIAPDHRMMSMLGCGAAELGEVLVALGYRAQTRAGETRYRFVPPRRRRRAETRPEPGGAFAALDGLRRA